MSEMLLSYLFLGGILLLLTVGVIALAIVMGWMKVRRTEQETALKQEMLRRGMSAEDIERVLRAGSEPAPPAAFAPGEMATTQLLLGCMAQNGVSGRVVEQVLAAVRAADPAARSTLCTAVMVFLEESDLDGDAKDEQVLGVVRGLTAAGRPAATEDKPPPAPADAAPIDDTFQPVRPL